MSEGPRTLSDDTFAEAVASGAALVDFYGTWCPPCKMLDPVIEDLARDFAGKALVAKINVDDNSEAAVENSIADIPTIILFKDGVETSRLFGAQSYQTLSDALNKLLV